MYSAPQRSALRMQELQENRRRESEERKAAELRQVRNPSHRTPSGQRCVEVNLIVFQETRKRAEEEQKDGDDVPHLMHAYL